jgi:gas vesicle protein
MFRTIKSLIAGVIAGTALGILFAPKEGKQVRKELKDEIDKGGTGLSTVKNTLTGMGKDIHGTSKDVYGKLNENDTFQGMKEKAKSTFENIKDEAKEQVDKAKKHVQGKAEDISKSFKKKK